MLANLAFKFDNAATGFGQCIRTTLFRRYCKARRQGLGVRRCLGRGLVLWPTLPGRPKSLTEKDRVIGFEPVFDLVKGAALRVDDKRGLTSSATSI